MSGNGQQLSTTLLTGQPVSLGQQLRQAFSEDDIDLLRQTIAKGATNQELALFIKQCQRTGLDPFARQIYSIRRKQWNSATRSYEEAQVIQVSIDGFRLIADRTDKYAGQEGPYWCGQDGVWTEVWLSLDPPRAAKVGVYRHDFLKPIYRVALYDSYVQTTSQGQPASRWKTDPAGMLAKCAEALALRAAFPNDLSGLYATEEMTQADNGKNEDVVAGSFFDTPSAVITTSDNSNYTDQNPGLVDAAKQLGGIDLTEPEFPAEEIQQGTQAAPTAAILTLEEALKEKGSDDKFYKDLDAELLKKRLENATKSLAKPSLDPDVKATYERRRAAIQLLLDWKKAGSPAPTSGKSQASLLDELGFPPEDPYSQLDVLADREPKAAYFQLATRLGWTEVQAKDLYEIERGDYKAAYTALRKRVPQS